MLPLVRVLGRGRATWAVAACVAAFVVLAGCDSNTPGPLSVSVEDGTPGHYGGPCNPDGTCASGLVCEHHVCKGAGD